MRFCDSARFWKKFHLGQTLFWICVWIISIPTGLINSVRFVSHLSAAALVVGAISSWQSTRVEKKQEDDADVKQVLHVVLKIAEEQGIDIKTPKQSEA